MKILVYPFQKLAREHLQAWSDLQLASTDCDSAYFRPEFNRLAAEVGRPVKVGVMEVGGQPVGFFPFEPGSLGTAHPVGRRISDFHGALVAPGIEWSGEQLLRGCGLRRFCFDHLPVSQTPLLTDPYTIEPSPIIDLSGGMPGYLEALRARGEKMFAKTLKNRDKTEREFGPVRFCMHEPTAAALDACFTWKSEQYERTGAFNAFKSPWVVQLLRRISATDEPHFKGAVSTLYVGDQLVAVHVGMRTATVLHYWFTAHDQEHPCGRFTPGLQLLTSVIQGAGDAGIRKIDLGKGDFRYKREFGTGASQVAEGVCGGASVAATVHRSLSDTRRWLRKSAETAGLATPVRWYRQMRDWLVMR